jgi:hypothetical protein
MNEFPSASLVSQIRAVILETFEVTETEATEMASGMAALAEGWGDSGMDQIDWIEVVAKRFGATLRWRSETQRREFESGRNKVIRSYEEYIRRNKRP